MIQNDHEEIEMIVMKMEVLLEVLEEEEEMTKKKEEQLNNNYYE